jgi:F-type H+-transporting ATPase subunit epsilon
MADTIRFDLVSPERRVASTDATQVALPGTDGDLAVGPGHEATITTLRPGLLRVETQGGTEEYAVTGGFAEISAESVTVLAERSMAASDMTQESFDAYLEEAEEGARSAADSEEPGVAADAAKLVNDMVAMGGQIGLSARQSNL